MPQATMTIILEDDGTVTVNGPLEDPILFHGLIGTAVDTQRLHMDAKRKASENRVQLAPGPLRFPGQN